MSHGGGKVRTLAFTATVLLLVGLLASCGSTTDAHVAVRVTPGTSLSDQLVHVTVTGLAAHQLVSIQLSASDEDGFTWQAQASYRADGHGEVDLARSPALSGSYHGVQAMGLMDALLPSGSSTESNFV